MFLSERLKNKGRSGRGGRFCAGVNISGLGFSPLHVQGCEHWKSTDFSNIPPSPHIKMQVLAKEGFSPLLANLRDCSQPLGGYPKAPAWHNEKISDHGRCPYRTPQRQSAPRRKHAKNFLLH